MRLEPPADLDRNVGGIDRQLRGVGAVLLVAVGTAAVAVMGVPAGLALAGMAYLGAAGLAFNYLTGFCGVNAMLGVDTCRVDAGDETRSE